MVESPQPSSGKIHSSELLLTASRFQVWRLEQRLADGSSHAREVVKHPGAVVVLPILDDGRICLIRNYRIAVDRELLELPAGTLEVNEAPHRTAERELIEETGYRAGRIRPLCAFFMSPGILDERMHAFVATELTAGPSALEAGEEIENHLVSPVELQALLREGQIQDAKSLSTLLYYLHVAS